MARHVGLTDSKIEGLKPPEVGQVEYPDGLVPGLRIRIGASGAKAFVLRKRVGGRLRNMTLGRYGPRFRLADARKQARSLLIDIEAGKDPASKFASKNDRGPAGTVKALWLQYAEQRVAELRSAREVKRIFEGYVLPAFGDRLADSVTRAEVSGFISNIAFEGGRPKPTMARAVLAQLSAFYTWALPKLERLDSNPCRDVAKPQKAPSRSRVLSDQELACLRVVAELEPAPWGPGILMLILTGQRREEVFAARWAEIDLPAGVWTIPADRAKNGVVHIVPLSPDALQVVRKIPREKGAQFLFPSRSNAEKSCSGFSKAWARVQSAHAKRLGGTVENFTMHDIRRSMATGMQRLGVRLEVVEAILNHVSGSRSGIVGIYQRHQFLEEKREALNLWGRHVAGLLPPAPKHAFSDLVG